MKQSLNNIRKQLFDAPAEVKSAFNDVVKYFDNKKLRVVYIEDIDRYWITDKNDAERRAKDMPGNFLLKPEFSTFKEAEDYLNKGGFRRDYNFWIGE